MKKILFLTSYYPNKVRPFIGPFLRNHAESVALNNEVCVMDAEANKQIERFELTLQRTQNPQEWIVYYKISKGIKYIRSVITFCNFLIGIRNCYKRIIREYKSFDFVHLNNILPMGIFTLLLNILLGKKYFITEHGTNLIYANFIKMRFIKRTLIKIISRRATRISAVTKFHAYEMIKCGLKSEIYVIPNVIHKHKYLKMREVQNGECIKLCHVSTLAPVKGVPEIIEACKILKEKGIKYSLDIIGGNNEDIHNLSIKINELELDSIQLHGWQDRDYILSKMAECDLFILNSYYETFCVVVAEALSCGLPVVVPNLPPILEFVGQSEGVIFDRQKSKLHEAIEVGIMRINEFNPTDLKLHIESKFSPEIIADQFESFYHTPDNLEIVRL